MSKACDADSSNEANEEESVIRIPFERTADEKTSFNESDERSSSVGALFLLSGVD